MPGPAIRVMTGCRRRGLPVLGIVTVSAPLLSYSAPTLAADPPASFAYVAEYKMGAANGVEMFRIDPATGSLNSLGFAPSGSGALSITLDPSRRKKAWVVTSDEIWSYRISPTGGLAPGQPLKFSLPTGAFAVHPSGEYAYATSAYSDPSNPSLHYQSLWMFSVDPVTAELTLPQQIAMPGWVRAPIAIVTDPLGRALYVAENAVAGIVLIYTLDANGRPNFENYVSAGKNPDSLTIDSSGQYLYAVNSGDSSVSQYEVMDTGNLAALAPPKVNNFNVQPSAMAITPDRQFAYMANFTVVNAPNCGVTMFNIGAGGVLTPKGHAGAGQGSVSVTVDVTGQFAYVANNLADTVTMYQIDAAGGLTQQETVGTGHQPKEIVTTSIIQPAAPNDFNGDGFSDIVWQNESGEVAISEMNGLNVGATARLGNPGQSWHIKGSGDFNGDGSSDILWQNDNGQVTIWEMNGFFVLASAAVFNPGPSWHIKGTGDFNGDGFSDILWQNDDGNVAIWEMNGFNIIASAIVFNPGPSWHIKGVGNFNGDGFSDILWQNDGGEVAIWEMNGFNIIASASLGNPGPSWHVITTGDFNGDRSSDILWQNDNGQVAIWEMSGFNVIDAAVVLNPGTSWRPVRTANFDANPYSDILWQNVSGEVVICLMKGTNISASASLGNPGQGWHPIAP